MVTLCATFSNIMEPEFCPQRITIELGFKVMKESKYFSHYAYCALLLINIQANKSTLVAFIFICISYIALIVGQSNMFVRLLIIIHHHVLLMRL